MAKQVTAWFKRTPGKVDGVLTVQEYDTVTKQTTKIFDRLPCRSGAPSNPDAVWERGVGAIPNGQYKLWLRDPVDPGPDFPKEKGGIGKAYRISNSSTNHDVIYGAGGLIRTLVRLHPENAYVGSAGCIATIWNKDGTLVPIPDLQARVARLFAYLDHLGKTVEYIELHVFQ